MLCPNCRRDIPIGKQYCPLCGHKIRVDFGLIQDSVIEDAGARRVKDVEGWLRVALALVVVAIVAIHVYNRNFETAFVFDRAEMPSIAVPQPGARPAPPLTHTPTWSEPELPKVGGVEPVGLTWRTGDLRKELARMHGADQDTEIAVDRALAYLNAIQFKPRRSAKPGHWAAVGAERDAIAATTGLVLLAFLGRGHTPDAGGFKASVALGVDYLVKEEAGGRIGPPWSRHMEGQALATAALAEAFASTGASRLRDSAEGALQYILGAQQENGGWKDSRLAPGPETVYSTAWQVYALRVARASGLTVPDAAFTKARAFFEKITDPGTGRAGLFTVWRPGDPELASRAQTAAAMAGRLLAGEAPGTEAIRRGASLLASSPPVWDPKWNDPRNPRELRQNRDRIDLVYLFFGTQAMFQIGGEDWAKWNTQVLKPFLLRNHDPKGLWPHTGKWAHRRGPAWTTAIAALCLETYYRDQ